MRRPVRAAAPVRARRPDTDRVDRRAELVDVAAHIFAEKGYDATSVQDIAAALGILKGSIYYHVDSKEDLLFEIAQTWLQFSDETLARLRDPQLGPVQRVRGYVSARVEWAIAEAVRCRVIVRDWSALAGERRELMLRTSEANMRFLRRQLTTAQQAGLVCPDLDTGPAARSVAAAAEFAAPHIGGRYSARRLAAEFADAAVASVLCDPRRHVPGHRRRLGALPDDWR